MPAAIALATGSLSKWFGTISPARLLSCRSSCSPRYGFGNRLRRTSRTTSHSSSSTWFSHGECQRDTTPKDPLPQGQLDPQTTFLLLHDRRIVFDGTTEELVRSKDPFIRNYLE